jgi:hypothetical protein
MAIPNRSIKADFIKFATIWWLERLVGLDLGLGHQFVSNPSDQHEKADYQGHPEQLERQPDQSQNQDEEFNPYDE